MCEEFIEKNQQLFRITLEKITDDNKFNLIESYKNSYVLKIDGSYKQIAAIEDEIKPKWLIGSNKRKKDKAFDTFKLLDNKIPTLSDKKVNAEHWKANKLTEPVT